MVLPRVFHILVNIENDDVGMLTEVNGGDAQRQRGLLRGPIPTLSRSPRWRRP